MHTNLAKLYWPGVAVSLLTLGPVLAFAQQAETAPATETAKQAQPDQYQAGARQGRGAANNGGGRMPREKTIPKIESGKWTGPRLPDGQPDVQGHWSNTISNHNNFTDPGGGLPYDNKGQPRAATSKREDRAVSRVTDPADGQIPFQPWAAAKVKEFQQNFHNPVKPQYIEPNARCAPGGIPKSFYWHGYEIRQYPGYVLFLFDNGTRIVHLDGKPHLPQNVKLWNADSRGHWEGNTLVVDVTNNASKSLFGRTGEFASENVHVAERIVFANDGSRFNVEATFTDPTVYTRPWTATIPVRRYTEKDKPDDWNFIVYWNDTGKTPVIERHEQICFENNIGFGNVAVTATK
ncbi:MAG: hypothetical protein HZA63_08340 [Rhodocyclales bacterium]|nr:hypothetical protein [Rhodocyclales bacterium]